MSKYFHVTRQIETKYPHFVSGPLSLRAAIDKVFSDFGTEVHGQGNYRLKRDGEWENVNIVPADKLKGELLSAAPAE